MLFVVALRGLGSPVPSAYHFHGLYTTLVDWTPPPGLEMDLLPFSGPQIIVRQSFDDALGITQVEE